MSELPTLSKEERALIYWCRWIRDWPLAALAWGNFRGEVYGAVLALAVVAIGVMYGIELQPNWVYWLGWGLCFWAAMGWLATRFQRMAILIDKLGLFAEMAEARRLGEQVKTNL
jgi:hypothetical protein